jgi:hypothetical protein
VFATYANCANWRFGIVRSSTASAYATFIAVSRSWKANYANYANYAKHHLAYPIERISNAQGTLVTLVTLANAPY